MKPCPFNTDINTPCDPELLGAVANVHSSENKYKSYIECLDCGARGPVAYAENALDAMQLAERQWDGREG